MKRSALCMCSKAEVVMKVRRSWNLLKHSSAPIACGAACVLIFKRNLSVDAVKITDDLAALAFRDADLRLTWSWASTIRTHVGIGEKAAHCDGCAKDHGTCINMFGHRAPVIFRQSSFLSDADASLPRHDGSLSSLVWTTRSAFWTWAKRM